MRARPLPGPPGGHVWGWPEPPLSGSLQAEEKQLAVAEKTVGDLQLRSREVAPLSQRRKPPQQSLHVDSICDWDTGEVQSLPAQLLRPRPPHPCPLQSLPSPSYPLLPLPPPPAPRPTPARALPLSKPCPASSLSLSLPQHPCPSFCSSTCPHPQPLPTLALIPSPSWPLSLHKPLPTCPLGAAAAGRTVYADGQH